MSMTSFYKTRINDESLPQADRDNYRKMYLQSIDPAERDKARAELEAETKQQASQAQREDADCAGGACKI